MGGGLARFRNRGTDRLRVIRGTRAFRGSGARVHDAGHAGTETAVRQFDRIFPELTTLADAPACRTLNEEVSSTIGAYAAVITRQLMHRLTLRSDVTGTPPHPRTTCAAAFGLFLAAEFHQWVQKEAVEADWAAASATFLRSFYVTLPHAELQERAESAFRALRQILAAQEPEAAKWREQVRMLAWGLLTQRAAPADHTTQSFDLETLLADMLRTLLSTIDENDSGSVVQR